MKQFCQHTVRDIRRGAETWRVLLSTSAVAFATSIAATLILHV
jgi:hypothetical protein